MTPAEAAALSRVAAARNEMHNAQYALRRALANLEPVARETANVVASDVARHHTGTLQLRLKAALERAQMYEAAGLNYAREVVAYNQEVLQ